MLKIVLKWGLTYNYYGLLPIAAELRHPFVIYMLGASADINAALVLDFYCARVS